MQGKQRIPTQASDTPLGGFGNLLEKLDSSALPDAPATASKSRPAPAVKNGGVVIRKEKAGRGGKTVLVLDQFATHLTVPFLEKLLARLRKACGCGGAMDGRAIELQGDQPARVRKALEAEGFSVRGITE